MGDCDQSRFRPECLHHERVDSKEGFSIVSQLNKSWAISPMVECHHVDHSELRIKCSKVTDVAN